MKEKNEASKVELKRLWRNAFQIDNFKNLKTLSDREKRLFWCKKTIELLVKFKLWKKFNKQEKIEIQNEAGYLLIVPQRITAKGKEKNGKKVSYSLKYLESSMNTSYYNVHRMARKILQGVVKNECKN